jgi:hypothetical protein
MKPFRRILQVMGVSVIRQLPLLRVLLAFLTVFTTSGCVAYYEPLAAEPTTNVSVDLSSVRLFVRRPELNDPIPAELARWRQLDPADTLEFRRRDADHIVDTLTEVRLFASVSYGLPDPVDTSLPGIAIRPYYAPWQYTCDGDQILLVMLTLGILPASCTRDLGIYFEVMDRKLPPFLCHWPQSEIVGWLPVLLATGFGSWERTPNHEAFLERVRFCVAEQKDLFVPEEVSALK